MQQAEAQIGNENYFDPLNGGKPGELHDVLARRLPSLQRSAYRLLGNAAEAEDAVQDALLSACKHLDQFRGESQFSTWLTAIVFNSARMRLRRRRRQVLVSLDERTGEGQQHSIAERLPSRGPNPEEEYRNYELAGHWQQSITQLSPTLLRTYRLCDMDGLSTRETAEMLGIPSGTVKARLARARKKLKLLMQGALQPRLCRRTP